MKTAYFVFSFLSALALGIAFGIASHSAMAGSFFVGGMVLFFFAINELKKYKPYGFVLRLSQWGGLFYFQKCYN